MGRLRAWVVWRIRRRCLPLHVCQTGHPYLFGLHGVFLRGGREVRSCFDRRSKTYFLLFRRTPPPNSISARVSSTSPDTNVSRVIGIFETAVCHCRSLFTRYHPHPPPPFMDPSGRESNYAGLSICAYNVPPANISFRLYFFLSFLSSRSPLSSSYKSAFNEREREWENLWNRLILNRPIETTLYPPSCE